MNQKKNMYNQLYGAITKLKKNWAYIDKDDYKLNYTAFYSIFGEQKTELFKFFVAYMFGL